MFLQFKKNSNVWVIFDRILEHLFTGIVKRCSAKQNGCCGSLGTRDQWTKIVTNCLHPHDVALICDRNHSHASWTTAQHEKKTFGRAASSDAYTKPLCSTLVRSISKAFLGVGRHVPGPRRGPLKSTSKVGAAQVGSRRSPVLRHISATGATVQGGHITVHTCDAKVEKDTEVAATHVPGVRVGARCLTTQDTRIRERGKFAFIGAKNESDFLRSRSSTLSTAHLQCQTRCMVQPYKLLCEGQQPSP